MERVRVAICGAGFAGIGAAIRLLQEGERDFVVFERADDVGGVWRDNRYPGCAVDIESHLYCYSFAPNPDWSHTYSPQPEIWRYLQSCVERFGVRPFLRLGHSVDRATWDDDEKGWRIETPHGTWLADVLIAAFGALSEPKVPALAGLETFSGQAFHSARWPDGFDVTNRRVAVIGTGASAAQIVPAIAGKVAHLTLLQRTPAWVLPRNDRPFTDRQKRRYERSAFARVVERGRLWARHELLGAAFLHRSIGKFGEKMARGYLKKQVPNEALRKKLTPTYWFGCKRVIVSDDYLASLSRDNVTVASAANEVRDSGIVDADGVLHEVETIVFGTGFVVAEMPFAERVYGRRGRSLAATWQGSPRAYMGTTVVGFPNLFIVPGPNTGLGHTSVLIMMEAQIEHVLSALRWMKTHEALAVEPRVEAQAAFSDEMDRRLRETAWAGNCDSWYLDRTGRNPTIWPSYTFEYERRARHFGAHDYIAQYRQPRLPGDRARAFIETSAGAVMKALPAPVQRFLSGGEILVDGQTLAPDVAVMLAAQRALGDTALTIDSPLQARARHRRTTLVHAGPRIEVGSVEPLQIAHLHARRYRAVGDAPTPIVVLFHGGGMVTGDLDTHDPVSRRLCRDANVQVITVDYRLAPEHPFPLPFDDACLAFEWVRDHARELGGDGRVVVGGDSAGGNLAAAVAQAIRGPAGPTLQLLVYPAVDRQTKFASQDHFAEGFLLTRADIEWFDACYTRDNPALHADVRISPNLAENLDGVAPALIYTAGFDPLRDEGEAYADRLAQVGKLVELRRFPSLIHGFLQMATVSRSSDVAIDIINRSLRRGLDRGDA